MRMNLGWAALGLCSLLTVGCGGTEPAPDQETSVQQGIAADEDLGGKTPNAKHALMATSHNLAILQKPCLDGDDYLKWQCSGTDDGDGLDVACSSAVSGNRTRVDDNACGYDGQCVSFIKGVAHSNLGTSKWIKGSSVFSDAKPGMAIATFHNGVYEGHAAIFLSYTKDKKGIVVMDENWGGSLKVKRHSFSKGGSGESDADSYYIVMVE